MRLFHRVVIGACLVVPAVGNATARTICDGRRFNRFLMPNALLSLWGITIKKTFVQMAFQTVAIPEYVAETLAAHSPIKTATVCISKSGL